jgi:hypothetical protein
MRNPAGAPLALRLDSSQLRRRLKRTSRTAHIRAARACDDDSNYLFGLRDTQVMSLPEERWEQREAQQREIKIAKQREAQQRAREHREQREREYWEKRKHWEEWKPVKI